MTPTEWEPESAEVLCPCRCMAWLGDLRPGEEPGQFLAPHAIAVDSRGDLYVGEVSWSAVGRHLDPPTEVRSFRKLVKVR